MAEKYIRMRTMISLCSAPLGAAVPDLIAILARSAELSNIKLRRSEKKVLNEVNHSDRVRFAVMNPAKAGKVLERISSGEDKIFILVNEGLSDTPTDKLDYSLRQDTEQVVTVGKRIAGAMVKYFEHTGKASETFNALLLAKSLRQRMWTDSQLETRQLSGIGPLIAQRLAAEGVHKLRQLAEIEPRRLETLAQRHYPFGNEVHAALSKCLPPTINLQCLPVAWLSGGLVELEITVERVGSCEASSPARLLVGSLHDDALLLCRSLALEQFPSPMVLRTRTKTGVKGTGEPVQIVATVVHERLVGVDVAVKTVVPPGVHLKDQPSIPPSAAATADAVQQSGHLPARLPAMASAGAASSPCQPPVEGRQPGSAALAADGAGQDMPHACGSWRQAEPAAHALPALPPVQPLPRGTLAARPQLGHAGRLVERSQGRRALSGRAAAAPSVPQQHMPNQPSADSQAPHPQLPLAIRPNHGGAAAVAYAPGVQQHQVPPPLLQAAAAGAAGKGKWSNFVQRHQPPALPGHNAPAGQAAQPQQQPGPLQQLSTQESLRRRAAANQSSRPPLGNQHPDKQQQQQHCALLGGSSRPASQTPLAAPGFAACQPPMRALSVQPGSSLFSQFALGAKPAGGAAIRRQQKADDTAHPGSVQQGWLGRGLLSGSHANVPQVQPAPTADSASAAWDEPAAWAEAAAKRRRLHTVPMPAASENLPAMPRLPAVRQPAVVGQAATTTLPVAASAGKALRLPKLGWLSHKFAPSAATGAAIAAPAAVEESGLSPAQSVKGAAPPPLAGPQPGASFDHMFAML